jgi:cytosolic 5'-nucleotidase 3
MKQKIVIDNPEKLEEIKKKIGKEGHNNFLILADFNKTFTYAFINGEKASTSFASIRNNGYLGEEYIKRAKQDFDKYHPVEIAPNVSFEEKDKAMKEWWNRHFSILVKYGLNKNIFLEIIEKGKVRLRKGVKDFFQFLNQKKVPLIIISSGLGDFIPLLLKKESIFFDNVYVYSNLFKFDSDGNAISMGDVVVHTANKIVRNVGELEYFLVIKNRKNVLLLGDSVGDVGMVEGFDYENLIKIGFLNEYVEGDLALYKENFDVVLTGDQDFDYVNGLVREMLA